MQCVCKQEQVAFACKHCLTGFYCSSACYQQDKENHAYVCNFLQTIGARKRERDVYDPMLEQNGLFVWEHCLKGYVIKKFIAGGTVGQVYQVCKEVQDDCDYVMKIVTTNNDPELLEQFDTESAFTQLLSDEAGVGPEVFGAWKCENYGFMVLEKWDGDVGPYEVLPMDVLASLEDDVTTLHEMNIVHADIMPRNVLANRDAQGVPIDATLTDFSHTQYVNDFLKDVDFVKVMYNYHRKEYPKYFKQEKVTLARVLQDPRLLDWGLIWSQKKHWEQKKGKTRRVKRRNKK